jgi:thiol-disulfide isomerase/thioredoxin
MKLLPLLLAPACVPVLETPASDKGGEDACSTAENDWPRGEEPVGLEAEGYDVGEVAPDFVMLDQHAEPTCLWQFHTYVVLLDISTMWCAPCQQIAADVQATADDYRDEDFVYVTVLAQDLGTDPPDTAELNEWSEYFGIAEPILSDEQGWYTSAIPGNPTFPQVMVIGRDLRVSARDIAPDDAAIRAAIEDAL